MDLFAAAELANNLIRQHLNNAVNQDHLLKYGVWRFDWNRRKRSFGVCWYAKRTIYLSAPLTVQRTEDRVRNTILHEIAHAIAGHRAGHGPIWKHVARQLGADPISCTDYSAENIQLPITRGAWIGTCPGGHQHVKYRRPRGTRTCAKCASRFDLRFKIEWSQA